MTTLKAKELTLTEVHDLLGIHPKVASTSFDTCLCLEALTDSEQQEIQQIRHDFYACLSAERVLEGLGAPPTYQLLPELNLMNPAGAIQLLQVLKAICKLKYTDQTLEALHS